MRVATVADDGIFIMAVGYIALIQRDEGDRPYGITMVAECREHGEIVMWFTSEESARRCFDELLARAQSSHLVMLDTLAAIHGGRIDVFL